MKGGLDRVRIVEGMLDAERMLFRENQLLLPKELVDHG
jgi:hypothetical protein